VRRYSHLLLDLDDTLYPNTSGVWDAVRDRIQKFIEIRLSLSKTEANNLRQRYLEQFGTTLTGLREEFSVDFKDYLDYVHDVPLNKLLSADPALGTMLQSINIPRILFTNSYLPHAERVLNCLGVRDEIDQVIDIYALNFHNKPKIEAYHRALDLISATDPSSIVFVDDRLANLEPAARLEMTTVLVGPEQRHNSHLHIDRISELTDLLPELTNKMSEV
jgi:putative hydrolase of the HAD superfamily